MVRKHETILVWKGEGNEGWVGRWLGERKAGMEGRKRVQKIKHLEGLLKPLNQQKDAHQHGHGGYIIAEFEVTLFSSLF